jgi:hypothetical protein
MASNDLPVRALKAKYEEKNDMKRIAAIVISPFCFTVTKGNVRRKNNTAMTNKLINARNL